MALVEKLEREPTKKPEFGEKASLTSLRMLYKRKLPGVVCGSLCSASVKGFRVRVLARASI
jgi:hypothetical protein